MEDIFGEIHLKRSQAEAAPSTTEGERSELEMTMVEKAGPDCGSEEAPPMEHRYFGGNETYA